MAKILGEELKSFWASDWDRDKDAFVEWYEITLKDGTILNDESEIEVHDIEDGAIITKVIGEAIVNDKTTKISTLYKRWKEAQTTRSYFVKVDAEDAEALMKLIVESGLKVSVEGLK